MNIKNDSGKHFVPARCRGARLKKQQIFIIALSVLLCSLISCITFAHLFTGTDPIENIFTDTDVSCDVVEEFDGEVKKNVLIKNNGDVQSYIRAAVVVTWVKVDEAGNVIGVAPQTPVAGTDYEITCPADSHWEKGTDGYWYYTLPVDAGKATGIFIDTCEPVSGHAPDGYYLSVEIVASSIQSTPAEAVTTSWSSGVSGVKDVEYDGKTLTSLLIKQ